MACAQARLLLTKNEKRETPLRLNFVKLAGALGGSSRQSDYKCSKATEVNLLALSDTVKKNPWPGVFITA